MRLDIPTGTPLGLARNMAFNHANDRALRLANRILGEQRHVASKATGRFASWPPTIYHPETVKRAQDFNLLHDTLRHHLRDRILERIEYGETK